jgi:crossover junction endodeoxyribonuclease RuvC
MVVLGIDPGLAHTGYGVVERRGGRVVALAGGVVETGAERELARRLVEIHAGVAALIAEHEPAAVAVEALYFGANVQTAFAVGQARGVVLLAAAEAGLPVFEFGPHEVKMAVTGYGRAAKDQVQRMVQVMLGLSTLPRPDDAADALAVAICLAHGIRSAA